MSSRQRLVKWNTVLLFTGDVDEEFITAEENASS